MSEKDTRRRRSGIFRCLVVFLTLFLLSPFGCGEKNGEAGEIELSSLVLQDSLALYYPVPSVTPASIPPYQVSPDLSNVAGVREAALPSSLARSLAGQGFAVTAGMESSIYRVYQSIRGSKFVTLDALLHSFRVLCDYALLESEKGAFRDDLRGLIASLHGFMWRFLRASQGAVREAALKSMAFLSVAAGLLEMEVDIPPEMRGTVEEELALISQHAGWATSPVFGCREDYAQYLPRGHYAGDAGLEGYFKAMTWLGRTGFSPGGGNTSAELSRGREMTRCAILLVGALHMSEVEGEPALKVWERIYQPSFFLMGASDSLNVYLYTRLMEEVFGRRFSLSRLADEAAVDDFCARALESKRSPGEGEGRAAEMEGLDLSFRLFGKPAAPDTYIFQQLVAPRVEERLMPRGLDIPAATGSGRALEILEKTYGEGKYEGYQAQMQALRLEYSSIDMTQKRKSAYWSWLEVMSQALKPCGEGFPSFMRGTAWQDRDLGLFLASWVEQRHGSLSYKRGGQAATVPASEAAKGYVEPRPDALARLAGTVDMLRRGLSERGLASAAAERLEALYQLLVRLKDMAEKELRNQPLSSEEYGTIETIGDTLQYLESFPAPGGEEWLESSGNSMALVSEVYADPNFGDLLEAAVGRPAVYYVIVPVEGRPTLAVGAGFSYYEMVVPATKKLDDEAWRNMLDSGQAPARPPWKSPML
jgi:hypothetical protein